MPSPAPPPEKHTWQVFGTSVVGARNLQRKEPKQDAIHWLPVSGRGRRVSVAVADGHGSAEYFRSAKGAHFAAHVAAEALREFVSSYARTTDAHQMEQWAQHELPNIIVDRWREEVDADLVKNPYREHELTSMMVDFRDQSVGNTRYLPYGSTLLAVAFTDNFLVALQMGDGNIGMLTPRCNGQHIIEPHPILDRMSISQCDAALRFRARVLPIDTTAPILVSLNTDGFRNAFPNTRSYLESAQGFLDNLRKEGFLKIAQGLNRWVSKQCMSGEGEDISIVFAYLLDDYHAHTNQRRNSNNRH